MRILPILIVLLLAVVAAGVISSPSPATEPEVVAAAEATATGGVLETSIVVETLMVRKGSAGADVRRWLPAKRLSAGEEVHYTVRVRNPGKTAVTDVVVTKRLPFGVRYELGSATGPGCQIRLSADGGRSFATPDSARNNKKASRKTAAPEYTHVRWVMSRPLAPGATALLRFRATFS